MERIALPAAPSTLNTWTGSFGFKELTELERLQLVNYTLLNFQDAVMCQKRLLDAPSEESTISTGISLPHDWKRSLLLKHEF